MILVDSCLTMVRYSFFLYLLYLIDKTNKSNSRQIGWDHPLRQVLYANIELRDEFFSEALRLSDEEIKEATMRLRVVNIQLHIWKDHYSGRITFYGNADGSGYEMVKCEDILEIPTVKYQFPLRLEKCPLLDLTVKTKPGNGGKGTAENLEVLLSHKAIILRACDGRFWDEDVKWPLHQTDPRPTDSTSKPLVRPVRPERLDRCGSMILLKWLDDQLVGGSMLDVYQSLAHSKWDCK